MGQRVYTVLLQDRHSDPEVLVFSDKDDAIRFARETAKELARDEDDYQEKQIPGWLFHAEYSCESDSVTVREAILDGELPDSGDPS